MRILIPAIVFLLLASRGEAQMQLPQEGREGWYQLNIADGKEALRRVQFFNRTLGWVCGDTNAYHTTNGGDSWTVFTPPTGCQYFYFMNDSTAFANGSTADKKHSTIMRTTDRGQTWSEPFWYPEETLHMDMTQIGDTVFQLNRGNILRSIDGGKSWIRFDNPIAYCEAISFSDSKNGYIVGRNGAFALTDDGGNSWFERDHSVELGLNGVFAISKEKVFAVGDFERINLTSNNGVTWYTYPYVPNGNLFNDIFFSDTLNGCIVGAPGLIRRTTDGGITWLPQRSTIEKHKDTSASIHLVDVCFVDSLYGWTVGWTANGGGSILRTRTGGFTSAGVKKSESTIIPTQIFPEPNNGLTRLKYSLPEAQNIKLTLHSMSGQPVKHLAIGSQQPGENEITLDLHDLPSGVYQFTLSSSKFTSTGQITVVR